MYRFLQIVMKWGWRLLFTGLSFLVLTMALCRLLFTGLPLAQKQITHYLSEQLNADLYAEYVVSDWRDGAPSLSIRGLTLQGKNATAPGFRVGQFDMELDLRASLFKWSPVFKTLTVDQVIVDLEQGDGATWSMRGIEGIAGSSVGQPTGQRGRFLQWLNNQYHLDIHKIQLNLHKASGEKAQVLGKYLTLVQDENQKRLAARLEAGSGFVEVRGKGTQVTPWSTAWSGTIQAEDMDLEQFCALWSGCHDDINTAEIELQTNWLYRDDVWQISGQVALPNVVYQDTIGDWRTLAGRSDLFAQYRKDAQWEIWLNNFTVHNEPKSQKESESSEALQWSDSLYLAGYMEQEYTITVASKKIDLHQLKLWVLDTKFIPESFAALIKTLNPYGYLNDVAMKIYPSRQPFDIDLSATLEEVSVDAWEGAPSGGNVSGTVRMGLLKGYLDLDTESLSLGLTELFRDVWYFDTATGRLYWDVIDDTYILKSDNLALTAPEGKLKGKLRLDIPINWEDGETLDMALTVGMTNGDARYTPKYLPALMPEMDDSLVEWLDNAVKSAHINSGGFLYNGALVDGERDEDSRWGLFFDLNNGHVQYAPEWPEVTNLSGQVMVNDDLVQIHARSAESAGGKLKAVSIDVPLGSKPVLQLNGQLSANGETIQHFLTATPIDRVIQGEAKSWQLAGEIDADLKLKLPINDMANYDFQLDADVKSFRYALPQENIDVQNIKGALSVSTEKGLRAKHLEGVFLGEPTTFSIDTKMKGQALQALTVDLSGRVSVLKLQQWLGLDWLSLLEGSSSYQAKLLVDLVANDMEFTLSSDLHGMEIELPPPLAKPVDKPMAFNLSLKPGAHPVVKASLGDVGSALVELTPQYTLDTAAIVLGVEDELPRLQSGQILVTGVLRELNLEPWSKRFGSQPGSDSEQKVAQRLEVNDVRIKRLNYGKYQWNDMLVSLNSDSQALKLTAQGPEIDGAFWMPHKIDSPYRLELNRVRLPDNETAKDSPTVINNVSDNQTEIEDVLAEVNPSLLPNMDVAIHSLQFGEKPASSLAFNLRRQENGTHIDNIIHSLGGMTLTGFADWVELNGEQRTWFQGQLQGKGVDHFQKTVGLPELLTAENSKLGFNISWKGSPLGLQFKEVKGGIDINLENGRLKQKEASTEALKLFGILNVETFRRRLQLDFSDLYASGIAFDKVSGSVRFDQGDVTFDKPIMIEGPNSSFKLDGSADTKTEQLDLKLVVTLPVTSNLPILSVLLGSTPQLAGIIFIADKLVGKQVDQLASIRYQIQGSFSEPEMTLDQLFSEKSKRSGGNQ